MQYTGKDQEGQSLHHLPLLLSWDPHFHSFLAPCFLNHTPPPIVLEQWGGDKPTAPQSDPGSKII